MSKNVFLSIIIISLLLSGGTFFNNPNPRLLVVIVGVIIPIVFVCVQIVIRAVVEGNRELELSDFDIGFELFVNAITAIVISILVFEWERLQGRQNISVNPLLHYPPSFILVVDIILFLGIQSNLQLYKNSTSLTDADKRWHLIASVIFGFIALVLSFATLGEALI